MSARRYPEAELNGQWFFASLKGRGESSFLVSETIEAEMLARFENAAAITGGRRQVREGEFDSAISYVSLERKGATRLHGVVRVQFRARDFAGRPGSVAAHGVQVDHDEVRHGAFDPFVLVKRPLSLLDSRVLKRESLLATTEDIEKLDPDGVAPDLPRHRPPSRRSVARAMNELGPIVSAMVDRGAFESALAAWLLSLLPDEKPVLLVASVGDESVRNLLEAMFLCIPETEKPLASFTTFRLDVPRDPKASRYPFRLTVLPRDSHVEDHVLHRKDVRDNYRVFLMSDSEGLREIGVARAGSERSDAAMSYARVVTGSLFDQTELVHTLRRAQGWARRLLRDGQGPLAPRKPVLIVRGPLARFVRIRYLQERRDGRAVLQASNEGSLLAATAHAMLAMSPARAMGLFVRAIDHFLRVEQPERAVPLLATAVGSLAEEDASKAIFPVLERSHEAGAQRLSEYLEDVAARLSLKWQLRLVRLLAGSPGDVDAVLTRAARTCLELLFPVGGSLRSRIYAQLGDEPPWQAEILGDGDAPSFLEIDRAFLLQEEAHAALRLVLLQAGEAACRFFADEPEQRAAIFNGLRDDLNGASAHHSEERRVRDRQTLLTWYMTPGLEREFQHVFQETVSDSRLTEAHLLQLLAISNDVPFGCFPREEGGDLALAHLECAFGRQNLPRFGVELVLRMVRAQERGALLASPLTLIERLVPLLVHARGQDSGEEICSAILRMTVRSSEWLAFLRCFAELENVEQQALLAAASRIPFADSLKQVLGDVAPEGVSTLVAPALLPFLRHATVRPFVSRSVLKLCREDPEAAVWGDVLDQLKATESDPEAARFRLDALGILVDRRRLGASRYLMAISDIEELDRVGFDAAFRRELYRDVNRVLKCVLESREGPGLLRAILADLESLGAPESEAALVDLLATGIETCLRSAASRRLLLPALAPFVVRHLEDLWALMQSRKKEPRKVGDLFVRCARFSSGVASPETWHLIVEALLRDILGQEQELVRKVASIRNVFRNAGACPYLREALGNSVNRFLAAVRGLDDEKLQSAFQPDLVAALVHAGRHAEVADLFLQRLRGGSIEEDQPVDQRSLEHVLGRMRITDRLHDSAAFSESFVRALREADPSVTDQMLEYLLIQDLDREDGRSPGASLFLSEVHRSAITRNALHDIFMRLVASYPERALRLYLSLPAREREEHGLQRVLRQGWDAARHVHPPDVMRLALLFELYADESSNHDVLLSSTEELAVHETRDVQAEPGFGRLLESLQRLADDGQEASIRHRSLLLTLKLCRDAPALRDALERHANQLSSIAAEQVRASLLEHPVLCEISELDSASMLRALRAAPSWVRREFVKKCLASGTGAGILEEEHAREHVVALARESREFATELMGFLLNGKDAEVQGWKRTLDLLQRTVPAAEE